MSHDISVEGTLNYKVPDDWMPFLKGLLDLAARIEADVVSGNTPDEALPVGRRLPTCERARTGVACRGAKTAAWWIQHGNNPHDHAVACNEHVAELLKLYMDGKRGVFLYPFPSPPGI